ncbi:hypothetical protein [Methylobacterium nigriterrae]|uniref:hypothetical protein n=1 Tax=Methylobacterium nigriterrae TaxID=3127512 RepID=UPI003013A6B7
MSSMATLVLAALLTLAAGAANAGDIAAAAGQDCADANSDYERYELGCPLDAAAEAGPAAARPAGTQP